MKKFSHIILIFMLFYVGPVFSEVLPSWNKGTTRDKIVHFVQKAVNKKSDGYILPAERIAVFDNDGTLWAEQPMYFQAYFMYDRLRVLAKDKPSWVNEEPYKSILNSETPAANKLTSRDVILLMAKTQSAANSDEFKNVLKAWLATAKHPRFQKLYKECVYLPMLELLQYLRANGFKTYIVSGGGVDFIRAFAEEVYGIPPEQVIGSSGKNKFVINENEKAEIMKLSEVNSFNDKETKAENIELHIGRRPVLAFGNSDGDLAMLQYTASGVGPRLMLLLHHDDEKREYSYDRESKIGHLDKAMDEALRRNWELVSIKNSFKKVFSFQ